MNNAQLYIGFFFLQTLSTKNLGGLGKTNKLIIMMKSEIKSQNKSQSVTKVKSMGFKLIWSRFEIDYTLDIIGW